MPSAHPTSTRARRLPREERRRQILGAAVRVFARQGYNATGTADIAREAGIGEPTIYRYFANKRALYLAAIADGAEEIHANWERIAAEAPDPLAALQRIGAWYYAEMQRRPELLVLRSRSFSESPDAEAQALARDSFTSIVRFVQSLFNEAKMRGLLRPETDVRTMTWLFMAVGSLIDLTRTLGVEDDFRPEDVLRLSGLLQNLQRR
jgi:AcrR family transcriptional regulator